MQTLNDTISQEKFLDLSIIIVNWNGINFLKTCLDSISGLVRDLAFEIIVVDNGSTDGSQEFVRFSYPDVILIENKRNLGFAKANNLGIKASKGLYISLVNSDIEFLCNPYFPLINLLEVDDTIGLVGPRIVSSNGSTQRSCMSFPSISNLFYRSLALDRIFPNSKLFGSYLMTYWKHDAFRVVDVVNGAFWITRKRDIIKVGLLSETYFIDRKSVV